MTRSHAFLAGIVLVGACAAIALPQADDIRGTPQWHALKDAAADRAGIPHSQEYLYELDHIRPCCLGGCDNRLSNLQMQPWASARVKDRREAQTCYEWKHGLPYEIAAARFRREYP